MITKYNLPLSLFFLTLLFLQRTASGDPELVGIIKDFDNRELEEDATDAHGKWLETAAGKEQLRRLVEHYDELSLGQRMEIPIEIARTGRAAVVPLVKKALVDLPAVRKSVMSGLYYALWVGRADGEFCSRIAPDLVPLLEHEMDSASRAMEVLAKMDPQLAREKLLTDRWLDPASDEAGVVVSVFNRVALAIPAERLGPLLNRWKKPEDGPWGDWSKYMNALESLARTKPDEALLLAEEAVKQSPAISDSLAGIYLAAAKLDGLYEILAEKIDNPEDLAGLPEPARFFFAVTCFNSDWSNGGISQALANSTGDYLPWARKGYKVIGDTVTTRQLDEVCSAFGPEGPSMDRATRNQQMEAIKPPFYLQEDQWEAKWAKEPNDPGAVPTEVLLARYAARNAETLRGFLKMK